jgi:hypothetical protein
VAATRESRAGRQLGRIGRRGKEGLEGRAVRLLVLVRVPEQEGPRAAWWREGRRRARKAVGFQAGGRKVTSGRGQEGSQSRFSCGRGDPLHPDRPAHTHRRRRSIPSKGRPPLAGCRRRRCGLQVIATQAYQAGAFQAGDYRADLRQWGDIDGRLRIACLCATGRQQGQDHHSCDIKADRNRSRCTRTSWLKLVSFDGVYRTE